MRKYKRNIITSVIVLSLFTVSCGNPDLSNNSDVTDNEDFAAQQGIADTADILDITATIPLNVIEDNYRTYYEVFVYSFCDSDNDGIGDLQ